MYFILFFNVKMTSCLSQTKIKISSAHMCVCVFEPWKNFHQSGEDFQRQQSERKDDAVRTKAERIINNSHLLLNVSPEGGARGQ